ncbi:MAG: hypothetical protein ACM3VZ_10100 [Acidobacteriota bacterium]
MATLFIQEIIVSFLLGGVPLLIASRESDSAQLLRRLASINPGDGIFLYLLALFCLHLLVYAINKWLYKPNEQVASFVDWLHGLTHKVGFGILGIYRSVAGAIPMAILVLLARKGAHGAAQATALSVILVLATLCGCVWLSALNEKTKRRTHFFSRPK